MFPGEHGRQQERRADGADLIEHFVDAETLAVTDGRGSVRENRVLRGTAHCFAGALGDKKRHCPAPVVHEREHRNRYSGHHVARNGEGPIVALAIGEHAEERTQRETHELASACGDHNRGAGRTERREETDR